MQLGQRDKELAAIGASVGCNCRPCVDHHIPAGRQAGLSEADLADAVATARAVRDEAIRLLAPRIDELLGRACAPIEPTPTASTSRAQELVALGASIGVNSHPLLRRHIAAALEVGLTPAEVKAAAKMASYVQDRAAEITADKTTHALDELGAVTRAGATRS
jgi:AhpD family alkylhydroperoxidase